MASNVAASNKMASNVAASNKMASNVAASNKMASIVSKSNLDASTKKASNVAASIQMASNIVASNKMASNIIASKIAASILDAELTELNMLAFNEKIVSNLNFLKKYGYSLNKNNQDRINALNKVRIVVSRAQLLEYIDTLKTIQKSDTKYYTKLDYDIKWLEKK